MSVVCEFGEEQRKQRQSVLYRFFSSSLFAWVSVFAAWALVSLGREHALPKLGQALGVLRLCYVVVQRVGMCMLRR